MALAGCSSNGARPVGKLVPVQGKVHVDGTPLSEGEVVFVPVDLHADAPTPNGKINADGTYSLATAGQPGAPEGRYRVMIKPGTTTAKAKSQINPIYLGPRSPLEMEVAENKPAGDYDLNLQPRKSRP
jgi:hypothetical protein